MNNTLANIQPLLLRFKKDVQKMYGERLAFLVLYGSYARGQARADSDIDIMVVLKSMQSPYSEIRRLADAKFDILAEYEKVVSTVPTTLARFEEMAVPLYRVVKKEGIII